MEPGTASQALPGRSSGSTYDWHSEAHAECALAAPLPLPQNQLQRIYPAAPLPLPRNKPQGVALAAPPQLPRDELQSVAGVRQSNSQEPPVEHDNQADATQDIIANAMQAVEAKRWVSSESAQPNTVEFWACIFKVHMCHNVTTPDKWKLEHKDFAKYITRE